MSDTSKMEYLIKNMGLLTISNFSSKILIFLLVPLYTSILSTTEYGTYDLAVSTASLFYPILTLNIVDAVMRFTMDKTYPKDDVAKIGFKYITYSCIIAGCLLLFLNRLHLWNDILGLEVLIFLYYVSYVFNQFFIQLAKGLERVSVMAVAGVIGTVAMIITNLIFLLVLKLGLKGFFIANIISQAIPVLYFFTRLHAWKYIRFQKSDRQLLSNMLIYCVPLIATVLGWWVNSTSDKYVVAFMCGVSANGILSVSYKIPQIINTLQGIFIQAWQISAIKEYGDKDIAKFYGNTFATINLLMCMACSWLILLTRPIASVLFAKDFYTAWLYVPFLLVSCVLNCASGLLGPILAAKKDSKAMMWSAIIGSGANIVLNLILVYALGIQGATIATAFCSYTIYWIRKRAVGKEISIDNYYIVPITWLLLCAQSVIKIFSLPILLEIILMMAMLLLNKKKELELINLVKGNFNKKSKLF